MRPSGLRSACRNPALAAERRRKRAELLDLTERDRRAIQARVHRARQPLRGAGAIGQAVGAVLGRRKVGKHFQITITEDDLQFARDHQAIAQEAARRLLCAAHQPADRGHGLHRQRQHRGHAAGLHVPPGDPGRRARESRPRRRDHPRGAQLPAGYLASPVRGAWRQGRLCDRPGSGDLLREWCQWCPDDGPVRSASRTALRAAASAAAAPRR